MAVRKRGDRWHIDFAIEGKRYRKTAGRGATKQNALALEKRYRKLVQNSLLNGKLGLEPNKLFGEALLKWVESEAPDSMLSHIRIVKKYLATTELKDIVSATSDMKNQMLADGLANQTINRRVAVVKRVLSLAYTEWEWLDQPVASKIKKLSEKGTERHVYLSTEQVTELCSKIENKFVRGAVLVLAYTGLRESEFLNLQPENWTNGRIVLDAKTKGKRPRVVPLPVELHHLMDLLPYPVSYNQLRYWFEKARVACGHPEWRIHDLRHTFASWLVSNPDVPLTVVRDLLGHSNLAVTSRYSHLRTEALDSAVGALKINV